jgi:FtsP/CotA-like multicopper oxidase with cupredoxin domain
MVRRYDFTVSRGFIAPDGYTRDVLLVNGAFPGPLIEANWGDTIVVNVHNNITNPEDGTAIHWHGFLQHETPWEDGAPGITQCPIPPKRSYRYEFVASLYGTSWYHAHYSGQYAGGVVGPIVVHGPTDEKYDIDLGPIMLNGESTAAGPTADAHGSYRLVPQGIPQHHRGDARSKRQPEGVFR